MVAQNVLNSHIVDVHCHPTDFPISPAAMDALEIRICAMSSHKDDQSLVRSLALSYPDKVIPCFGYHPWFTHRISLKAGVSKHDHYQALFSPKTAEEQRVFNELVDGLPIPMALEDVLADVRHNLDEFPDAMLGEVGLDRSFRVAYDYFASPRRLTPFTIPIEHQLAVLRAQIDIAIELRRNISLHSVKSQQATMDLLSSLKSTHGDRWNQVSLDMHSCGLSPEMWKDIQRKYPNIFLSLSTIINGRSPNHKALIEVCAPGRILVESDFNEVSMCTEQTWAMLRTVADVKGWTVETEWEDTLDESNWGAIRKLERNWKAFQVGNHPPIPVGSRKARKREAREAHDWTSDMSSDEE